MMFGLREWDCFAPVLMSVNVGLACVDAIIAALAFYQFTRIHSRNSLVCWTRQKVFHLIIGTSNIGFVIYFSLTLAASCNGWLSWSGVCEFILMGFPSILLFAAFLLLLSYWVDLCHQADDDEDEEECHTHEALLENASNEPSSSNVDSHRRRVPFRFHIGNRQKMVILVTVLVFVVMMAFAVLIWIGTGKNVIDPPKVAQVYVDLFAVAMLILGGALACYGLLLCLKMRKVRSERASSDMRKVSGLAVVSVVCFTSSAIVGLLTDVPVLYNWLPERVNHRHTSIWLILYYFIGSSVPSAFLLWVMRELPPLRSVRKQEESRIAFVSDDPQHQRWTVSIPTATGSSQNQNQDQVSRARQSPSPSPV